MQTPIHLLKPFNEVERVLEARPATPHEGGRDLCIPGLATRDEVLQTIRSARMWFENHEPSSPVAVLLKQSERMAGQRFAQVADAIPLDLLRKWDSAGETPR